MPISNQTSRGDLLRWLRRCQTQDEKCLSATILGYEWHQPEAKPNDTGNKEPKPEPPEKDPDPLPIPTKTDLKRPQELFYALSHHEYYADPEQFDDHLPPALQGVQALTEADLQPLAAGEPLTHQTIVAEARMRDFLRRSLSHSTGHRLDIPQLVRRIARLQTLYHLPRKPRVVPAGRVYVLLDLNKRLLPFWLDAHRLCESIVRQHGLNGLEIRVIDDDPQGEYWDWFDESQQPKPWQTLAAQSLVFIVSDLGQLAEQDSPIQQRWDSFFQQLSRKNCVPIVLAPLSAAQQQLERLKNIRQILWNKHSKLRPQKFDPDSAAHAEHVRRVLAMLSIAVHVEPELLRAILSCLPAQQADSGIEAAVYQHPDMQWGYTAISMRPEKRAEYQAEFKQLDAGLQFQILNLLKRQHIGQFPAIWAEEIINAMPLVSFPLEQLADVEWAKDFMQRIAKSMIGSQSADGMTQFARRHLSRLSGEAIRLNSNRYTSALYGLAYREQLRAGAALPAEYDAQTVQAIIREPMQPARYAVWQYGESIWLTGVDQRPAEYGGVQFSQFIAVHDSIRLMTRELDNNRWSIAESFVKLPLEIEQLQIIPRLRGQIVIIDTGMNRLTLMPFRKPNWSDSIFCSDEGLTASLFFAGKRYELRLLEEEGGLRVRADENTFNLQQSFGWLIKNDNGQSLGFDQYGLYADLTINQVTQRFRWIEPGTFMMGSPQDEPERYDNETLHPVTLTRGFWLADTAVTQALWLAVMGGDNPSDFKDDPNNPVENVSWQDAQTFIAHLNDLVPGLQAQLPSEAQWEWACRAGTTTAFSFGANITPEQVNYDGNYPYADGKKGLYRGKTVPVKSLPGNPWGLYEMHGNVWEWCQDVWQADLGTAAVVDPLTPPGDDAGGDRVLRGGSWRYYGRLVRSAIRYHDRPGIRGYNIGFRLALGQSELKPGQAGGAEKPATGRDVPGPDSGVAEQPQVGRGASLLGKLFGRERKKK